MGGQHTHLLLTIRSLTTRFLITIYSYKTTTTTIYLNFICIQPELSSFLKLLLTTRLFWKLKNLPRHRSRPRLIKGIPQKWFHFHFPTIVDYQMFASWEARPVQACSNNFSMNAKLKCSFASRPCDTVRHRFLTWACWTPIFHQTQNLTYFTEAEGRPDSSRLAPLSFSVWLAVGLREIVVNLSRTWKVLYWLCDAAVGPDSAFDVLILSHWCQSTSAAVILPRGSMLHLM